MYAWVCVCGERLTGSIEARRDGVEEGVLRREEALPGRHRGQPNALRGARTCKEEEEVRLENAEKVPEREVRWGKGGGLEFGLALRQIERVAVLVED